MKAEQLLQTMDRQPAVKPTKKALHDERQKLPTLRDLGISETQSHRWQQEANVPEKEFQHHIEKTKAAGRELTSAGALRLAWKIRMDKIRGSLYTIKAGQGCPTETISTNTRRKPMTLRGTLRPPGWLAGT